MRVSSQLPLRRLLQSACVVIAASACASTATARTSDGVHPVPSSAGREHATDRPNDGIPEVRLRLGSDDTYRRGDRARAYFEVDRGAYVTVVRVDTDGRMRILFPRSPVEDGWVRGGHEYRVGGRDQASFRIDDETGLGYVFAIASDEPFDFRRYDGNDFGDFRTVGRVGNDPFIAIRDLADALLSQQAGYTTDYVEYYVNERVRSTRYGCYHCGGGSVWPWPYPGPYGYSGWYPPYIVVLWGDPYYYHRPYRRAPRERVVYAARPRYESKPAAGGGDGYGGGAGGGYGQPGTGSGGNGGAPDGGRTPGQTIDPRRRPADGDPRRPGRATEDVNLGGVVDRAPGATKPGDDVIAAPSGGGRRTTAGDAVTASRPTGLGTPRRDPASGSTPPVHTPPEHTPTGPTPPSHEPPAHTPPTHGATVFAPQSPRRDDAGVGSTGTTNGNGNGSGGGTTTVLPTGRGPRRDPGGGDAASGRGVERGSANGSRRIERTGTSDPGVPVGNDGGRRGERGASGSSTRPAVSEQAREQPSSAPTERAERDAPTSGEKEQVGTGWGTRRAEPGRRDDTRSAPAASAPRDERRTEPRRETRSEPRAEPKRETRSEPRAEPKRETRSNSGNSNGGSGGTRRKTP